MLPESADARESLLLKSTAADNRIGQTSSNIVLCTDNQTYEVRQVHSSNSCFVIQPSQVQRECGDLTGSSPSLCAIAQCTATLELSPELASVEPYLRRILPVYGSNRTHDGIFEGISKTSFVDNAPFSDFEIQEAWTKECTFEFQGTVWRPDASMLLGLWRSIISSATLNGIDPVIPFAKASLTQGIEEEDFPVDLLDAALIRLASQRLNLEEGRRLAVLSY